VSALGYATCGAYLASVLPDYDDSLIAQMRPEERALLPWDSVLKKRVGLCGCIRRGWLSFSVPR
jgi:hypothetical protein